MDGFNNIKCFMQGDTVHKYYKKENAYIIWRKKIIFVVFPYGSFVKISLLVSLLFLVQLIFD